MHSSRAHRLLELTLALNSTMDPDQLLDLIIERATDLLECEAASLLIFDESAKVLRFLAATGAAADRLDAVDVPLDDSLAGTIFLQNRPLVVNDTSEDGRHYVRMDDAVDFDTCSLVGVPMSIEGRPTGVLEGINKKSGPFDSTDVETLSIIAAQAAVALRNARQLASIREAHESLKEIDTLKTQIMAITSHELRTPLATILGYSDILHEEASEELKPMVTEVVRAGDRMLDIIEKMTDLLDLLNRDDDGSPESLDLVGVVERVVAALAESQRDRIDLDLPAGPIAYTGHTRYLERAVGSLIDNALRFSTEDTFVQVRVSIADEIALDVEDEGIGLDPAEMDRIFEAFYQVEHHLDRSYEGLGLGLTLAREVAQLHSGRMDVRSAGRGKGACFTLRLPKL